MKFLKKVSNKIRKSSEDQKELLVVSVTDQDLVVSDIRNQLFNDLDNVDISVPSNEYILKHQGFVDGCDNIQELINHLQQIEGLNQDYLQAIKAVSQYNTIKLADGGNSALPAKREKCILGGKKYSNYEKYIYDCSSFLYNRYDFSIKVVGEFDGVERESWHKVKTPYGTFTNGNWNKEIAPENTKPGDMVVENPGFMIGERMRNRHDKKKCIVIDAGHKHGSKGSGTARIVVLYDDGNTEIVVPWGLQREFPNKDSKLIS